LIAATSLVHHLTVVTRHLSDFVHAGVPVLNPWNAEQTAAVSGASGMA